MGHRGALNCAPAGTACELEGAEKLRLQGSQPGVARVRALRAGEVRSLTPMHAFIPTPYTVPCHGAANDGQER